ncbi:hypothetical protein [Streptomyces luteocolor]|uniref:hypothetical protein n=1 Tax=Streptomyces luteocolor TaxID=285500 RepID=UPI000853A0BE|nr:hypothetical protein [Streptomyces luteocolor]
MFIVYTPAGGEPEHYDATTLRVSEVSIVQRTIDQKWGEIKEGLRVEDLDAMRGIVWVIKKRSQPTLRFGEFDPGVTEMVTRLDNDEARAWIDNTLQIMDEDPEVSRESVVAAMRELPAACIDPEWVEAQIAAVAEGPKEEPEPLAPAEETPPPPQPSPTSASPETSTSASSPTFSTSAPEMSTT